MYFCNMIRKIMLLVFLMINVSLSAQRNEIKLDRIHTLQVLVNGKWNQSPLMLLGSDDYINVSFDDLTHEYHRYRYKVEMCNFDWQKNDQLFESDYLRGETNDQPIDKYEKSINTTVLYTHYSFTFPNARVGVTKSGNYRITIFDDDEQQDVAVVYFSVVDDKAAVTATVTTNTDIDKDQTHQQVKFNVNASGLRLTNPATELKTIVLQNNRWDNAAINPKPDFLTPSDIQWKYAKELIFNAANEYRKFELTNLHFGSMGIDNIRWFDPYFHAELYQGKDRRNYIYDEDQDGAYYIRTQEYDDFDLQSDYVLVHFSVKHQPEADGDIYINGALTNDSFLPAFKMTYNNESQAYENTLLLKQGYYNYLYLFLPQGGESGVSENVEGDFFQTENKYTILVYFSPEGGRYDQLVGVREFRFMPGK